MNELKLDTLSNIETALHYNLTKSKKFVFHGEVFTWAWGDS